MRPSALDLTGKLLVAMPGMGDPRFAHAVIYLTQHGDKGAMGLMVNKPAPELRLSDVLDQLIDDIGPAQSSLGVHIGGPVETGRGFVLHSGDFFISDSTLTIDDEVCLTATVEILKAMAEGRGPKKALLALGYAGWGAGQLEQELRDNVWLTCAADEILLFGDDHDHKWSQALAKLGVDPGLLYAAAGQA